MTSCDADGRRTWTVFSLCLLDTRLIDVIQTLHTSTLKMSSWIDGLLKLCGDLFENEEIRNTLRYTRHGVTLIGGLATVGGLLLGPVGLFVGGGVGSVSAYLWTRGLFQSLLELFDDLVVCIEKLRLTDYAKLLTAIMM
ncbi:hypothetical protein F2P81_016604 [Scophthalmus maximus]|uniref:Uncharacterized protein n=2 Tax=Scophthalmus maximus TaxID=52904 RepID=A0A6A4SHR3_SCOMX|nr:hypothetical protein F2P81_016604 [Scophthalmus maximus]